MAFHLVHVQVVFGASKNDFDGLAGPALQFTSI